MPDGSRVVSRFVKINFWLNNKHAYERVARSEKADLQPIAAKSKNCIGLPPPLTAALSLSYLSFSLSLSLSRSGKKMIIGEYDKNEVIDVLHQSNCHLLLLFFLLLLLVLLSS